MSSKALTTFTGHRISKTMKTIKCFMILLVTPETQHKTWVLILLGSNINIIIDWIPLCVAKLNLKM